MRDHRPPEGTIFYIPSKIPSKIPSEIPPRSSPRSPPRSPVNSLYILAMIVRCVENHSRVEVISTFTQSQRNLGRHKDYRHSDRHILRPLVLLTGGLKITYCVTSRGYLMESGHTFNGIFWNPSLTCI